MAIYRNWVHGSDVNVRFPDNADHLQRTGSGTFVRQEAGTSNRFYFAIPTPAIINNNKSIEIEEVHLHVRMSGAVIRKVTVHEAAVEIFGEDTDIQGEEIQRAFDLRGRITSPKLVQSAINFGIEVDFAETTGGPVDSVDPTVTLIAAGAQFDTNTPTKPTLEEGQVVKGTFFVNSG